MEISFHVELDNNTINQYEYFLDKFYDWKIHKRDIKINSILDNNQRKGESMEFILDMKSHKLGAHYIEFVDPNEIVDFDTSLTKVCGCIKSAKFKVNQNRVESLDIEVKILTTLYGKIVKGLVEDGDQLSLKQLVRNEFIKFYMI